MASDLIPEPSPAGRARGEWELAEERAAAERAAVCGDDAEKAVAPSAATPEVPRLPSSHPARVRIALLIGALFGVAVAMLAVTGAMVAGGALGDDPAATWSKWKPSDTRDGMEVAQEIADHVSREYRGGKEGQLVTVDVYKLTLPVTIRNGGPAVAIEGKHGLIYTLLGLGNGGYIDSGTPSAARKLLLQRQALELALHTFTRITDVDQVIVVLPPPAPAAGRTAAAAATNPIIQAAMARQPQEMLHFRPGDVRAQLERPLAKTLTERPISTESFSASERELVRSLTRDNLFAATVRTGPDQQPNALVLSRQAYVGG